jgi:sulfur-carrier protein
MKVRIPSMLTDYTNGQKYVEGKGENLLELVNNLDKQFSGIKFRFIDEHNQIRNHMLIFVNKVQIKNLNQQIKPNDEIFITQSLSGG